MISRRTALALFAGLTAMPGWAASLEKPSGRVLLTMGGAIARRNDGDLASFDRAMLEGLDWREIETFTYFTEGKQTFSGPTLSSLLAAVGVSEGTLHAVALDDYSIDIPVSDLDQHDILLALHHNGEPMRVRDKGPIWIIYPAARERDIGDRHKSHSIWQLTRLDVMR